MEFCEWDTDWTCGQSFTFQYKKAWWIRFPKPMFEEFDAEEYHQYPITKNCSHQSNTSGSISSLKEICFKRIITHCSCYRTPIFDHEKCVIYEWSKWNEVYSMWGRVLCHLETFLKTDISFKNIPFCLEKELHSYNVLPNAITIAKVIEFWFFENIYINLTPKEITFPVEKIAFWLVKNASNSEGASKEIMGGQIPDFYSDTFSKTLADLKRDYSIFLHDHYKLENTIAFICITDKSMPHSETIIFHLWIGAEKELTVVLSLSLKQ